MTTTMEFTAENELFIISGVSEKAKSFISKTLKEFNITYNKTKYASIYNSETLVRFECECKGDSISTLKFIQYLIEQKQHDANMFNKYFGIEQE